MATRAARLGSSAGRATTTASDPSTRGQPWPWSAGHRPFPNADAPGQHTMWKPAASASAAHRHRDADVSTSRRGDGVQAGQARTLVAVPMVIRKDGESLVLIS